MVELDRIDRALLRLLQADARMPNAALAERVGLSPSPCLRRVRRLEASGLIRGHTAILDARALGLGVDASIEVTLGDQARPELEAFEAAVAACEEVVSCHLVTGDADYLLRVLAPDLDAYQRFLTEKLTRIPGVSTIRTSFALKEVVQRRSLPLDHLEGG